MDRPFFVDPELLEIPEGVFVPLPAKLHRHVVRVLRAANHSILLLASRDGRTRYVRLEQRGERWGMLALTANEELPNAAGAAACCEALSESSMADSDAARVDSAQCTANVQSPRLASEEARVALVFPLLPSQRLDWVLEKAVELGANELHLYLSERSPIRWDNTKANSKLGEQAKRPIDKKLQRWERQLLAAAHQSGNLAPPTLFGPQPLEAALRVLGQEWTKVAAVPNARATLPSVRLSSAIALISGAEAGFSADELRLLDRSDVHRINLGARILRAETAPIAMLSAIRLGYAPEA
ncbi:MAG: RsmE family RNA methyltransferase [Myxococcota bacterium]|jgi:16S rRNA (uracil1498-N3)-methyltransferase|nr:RsmE family RNA methyltransferase [Myxococcota bacterium]